MSNKIKSMKKKVLSFTIAGAIAFTPLVASAELGDQTLALGMKNADVQALKDNLLELNYLEVNTCGSYFDEMTEAAVKRLQRDYNVYDNGIFEDKSFEALQSALKANLGDDIIASYKRVLKVGSNGADVEILQEGLKELGFINSKVNNKYDKNIEKAVKDFQFTYGLSVDGNAGKETFNTLGKIIKGEIKRIKPKTAVDKGSKIVETALTHKGKPYVFGASNGKAFDCSGFTQYVYKQNGITVPRTTRSQAKAGTKVTRKNLQPGDLIIFSNTYQAGPSHAGIYMGSNNFIHASSGGKRVMVSSLNQNYYKNKFSYGRRVF